MKSVKGRNRKAASPVKPINSDFQSRYYDVSLFYRFLEDTLSAIGYVRNSF